MLRVAELDQLRSELRKETARQNYEWTEETLNMINDMTKDIQGKGFSPDWFTLRNRFEERDREVERLREALKLWKVYFQTEDKGPLTNPEQAGEDFTEAWFVMEEALK